MSKHRLTNDVVPTRDRLVREGMRLFAEKGYRATTVGEIEEAAGLSPRAGGLYKHFASKREVFEAGIERHVADSQRARRVVEMLPLQDLRSDLTLAARWVLAELAEERDMMLILQRDGRDFPEIQKIGARPRDRPRLRLRPRPCSAAWLEVPPARRPGHRLGPVQHPRELPRAGRDDRQAPGRRRRGLLRGRMGRSGSELHRIERERAAGRRRKRVVS